MRQEPSAAAPRDVREWRRPVVLWSAGGLLAGGGVGVFVGYAMFGWLGALAAVIYLVMVIAGILEELDSPETVARGLSGLLRASWLAAAGWALLAAYTVAMGSGWWPVLYAIAFAGFAASAAVLRRALKYSSHSEADCHVGPGKFFRVPWRAIFMRRSAAE